MTVPRTTAIITSFLLLLLPGCEVQGPSPESVPERVAGAEPDYSAWSELLSKYRTGSGMDYAALAASDGAALDTLRTEMAKVDVDALTEDEQLAYWINLYNISTVGIVTEHYPVDSIRDISTDPVRRLNVFKSDLVPFQGGTISLDTIENEHVRKLGDARIHFAINCAAESCPPIRAEPFSGDRIDQQLDEQTRAFLNGPNGVTVEQTNGAVRVHTTKIMEWFAEDFDQAGGALAFIRRYLDPGEASKIAGDAEIVYDDYSWKLNDSTRN